MMDMLPTIEAVKFAAHCTRCNANLVLSQHPDCPKLNVEVWLKIIVCNRCSAYLEAYRRLDNAIAYICTQLLALKPESSSAGQVRAAVRGALIPLTQQFHRLLINRWRTLADWSEEIVDLILDKPDKSRMVCRFEEANHRKARERADKEAQSKQREELPL